MGDVVLEFNHVWKKFKKGERYDSLRDFIPAIAKRLFNSSQGEELQEKEFWSIKDVSFQIMKGEALGIIGPNGAGKSTVLKLLSGILKPNKGDIKVNGRLSALIEVGAGFHPDLTSRENIYLNGTILGMKKKEIDSKFDEIVEFSGLEEFIDTPVKRYSSGMYARLGFSVAAHVDPEVLLVDEVLSVGDFVFQTKCIKKMHDIIAKGVTIIFISHNIPSIIQLCPKAILLNKGEIQKYGDSNEVCRFYYRAWAEVSGVNKSIQLIEIKLLNKEGKLCEVFQAGDYATLKLVACSDKDIQNLIMGFALKGSDGLLIFNTHSVDIQNRYFSFAANEYKGITIHFRVNLPSNTYLCGIYFQEPMKEFHFFNDEIIKFSVKAPKSMGYAFLDINWD